MSTPGDSTNNAAQRLQLTINVLRDTRQNAELKIAEAIRELELALRDVLGPRGRLLGMPNLGDGDIRVSGLVVRSLHKLRLRLPDPGQSHHVLVLRPEGTLEMVELHSDQDPNDTLSEDVTVTIRPVRDNEFMPSDLRAVVETVEQAIRQHLTKVDQTTRRWSDAGLLADQLLRVLSQE
jgi:hypothetical protein